MRIVIPVMGLDFGGGERVLAEVANGLATRGHDVVIVIPYGGRIAWPLKVAVHWVPVLTEADIPPGDIIMPNFYPTVLPAYNSGRGKCVRLALAYEPLWLGNQEALASYDLPMPIIVISEWQRALVAARTASPTFLLHPGVDTTVFHPYPKPNDGLKRVLFLMRTHGYHWKGQRDFAAAHSILLADFPELQVIIVPAGAGQNNPEYPLACVWKYALGDTDMGRIYAEADIFVYPSRFESFGLPPLEAMACGTATVVGDCGGVREYARHLENCLVVEPGNPPALASTIAALLNDPITRQKIAGNGIRTAQAWSWQRTYQEIEAILQGILYS